MRTSDPHRGKAQSNPEPTNAAAEVSKTRSLGAIAIATDRDHISEVEEHLEGVGLMDDLALFRAVSRRLTKSVNHFILILRADRTLPIIALYARNLRSLRWQTIRATAATIDSGCMWLRGLDDTALEIVNGVLGETSAEFMTVVDPELDPAWIRVGE
jgi:hypothetical protein